MRKLLAIIASAWLSAAACAQTVSIPNLPGATAVSPTDLVPIDQAVTPSTLHPNGRQTVSAPLSMLNGSFTPISGTPAAGYVPIATGPTTAVWGTAFTAPAYTFTQALSGAATLGNLYQFTVTSDTQGCTFCTQIYSTWNYGGATARGARANFFSWNIQTAPNTGSGTTAGIGATLIGQTNTGDGGGIGTEAGTYFGANPICAATAFVVNCFGIEADVRTDTSYRGLYTAAVAAVNYETHQATKADAAFLVYSGGQIAAAGGGGPWGVPHGIGFHCGVCFAELSNTGFVPLDATATVFGTHLETLVNIPVTYVFDLRGFAPSNNYIIANNFDIDLNGKADFSRLNIGGATPASIIDVSATTANKAYATFTNTTNSRTGAVGVVDGFNVGLNAGPSTAIVFQNNGTTEVTILSGMQIGSPTGGDKGVGTLNIQGTIWTNGTQGLASKTCTINAANVTSVITLTITNGLITGTTTC